MTQAAGKLNHRIRLESLETSQDANGETLETWTNQGDVWANVSPVSGKEFISSAAMQSQIVARITIRYRSDVQSTWRIRFRNRYYNIEGVLPDVVSGLEYLTLPVSYGIQVDDTQNDPENFQTSLLYRNTANQYFVFLPRTGTQMVLLEFINNSTTNTDSLAVTNSDITRFRLSGIRTAADVYLSYRTHSATNGTWTNNRTLGSIPPMQAWNAGTQPTFDSTVVNGAWREYVVTPVGGDITATFRALSTGSNSVSVTINGLAMETFSLANSVTQLVTKTYTVGNVPVTVRVTNNTSNELGVAGFHFQTLRTYNGAVIDKMGWGRNTVNFADYLTQSSSNDSVAKEFNSGIYGGGYHGGEQNIVESFTVGGVIQSLGVGEFSIGPVELHGTCLVDWASVGGGRMAFDTRWTFPVGAVRMTVAANGFLRADEFFTAMGGFSLAFSQVTAPVSINLAAAPDNSRHPLGNFPTCTLQNPTTGQRIVSTFNTFDVSQNLFGGPHFWHLLGSYNKLYNGPVVQGDLTITSLNYTTTHTMY